MKKKNPTRNKERDNTRGGGKRIKIDETRNESEEDI